MLFNLLYRFFYPTGCTKPIVASPGFLSKNPPPWDDPWVNMGGHPPIKKKKHPSGFFVWAEKVRF